MADHEEYQDLGQFADPWILRTYRVVLGIKVQPTLAHLDGVRIFTVNGEQVAVLPNRDDEKKLAVQNISLSYTLDKAAHREPLGEAAAKEAFELAEKRWKRDHPDDADITFVGYALKFLKSKPIENTLVPAETVAEASA